ncbi:hypothetical protein M514_03795 [Trichuris suis]|uniref:Major sperm protein n=1 Tax=Trichuris suis TaxID=68888 RepID=A0A085MZN9_9BILA|nr:hypothetical protein M514_03795 [Trichuris suis]
MDFGKGTLEIIPSDAVHFSGDAGIAQIAYVQLYNNSDEYIAYKLKTNSPGEVGFEPASGILEPFKLKKIVVHCTLLSVQHEQQNKEWCTVVARLIPAGIEATKIYDKRKVWASSDYIEKMYRLEVRYDLDSCDILQPTSSSSHISGDMSAVETSKVSPGRVSNEYFTRQ